MNVMVLLVPWPFSNAPESCPGVAVAWVTWYTWKGGLFSGTEGYPSRCLIVSAYTCSPLVLMELLQLSLCGWGCCYLCGFQPKGNRTSSWTPVHRASSVPGFPSTWCCCCCCCCDFNYYIIYCVSKSANVVGKLKKLREGSCSMLFIEQHFSISCQSLYNHSISRFVCALWTYGVSVLQVDNISTVPSCRVHPCLLCGK